MGEAGLPLPDFRSMVRGRSRLAALGLGLPLVLVALGACGDDAPTGGEPGTDDAVGRGQQLARTRGCSACHGADGQGGLGPAWTDAMGNEAVLADGSTVTIDEAYLTLAITDPGAQVVEGFTVTMPKTTLTDAEVADLVAYITSLSG